MNRFESYLTEHQAEFVDALRHFLTFPSVSSLPEHKGDMLETARCLADQLRQAGLETVELLSTKGNPVVYGEWPAEADKPTVLIYGHYDVQPVDPLDQWRHPPFAPYVSDDRIYARGASDDKGNLLAPVIAAAAMLKTRGRLPLTVKFLFEGEEEIGSPNLDSFIRRNRDRLACDLILSADGGQWAEDQPGLTIGLRGICGCQIDIQGAGSDLHSGHYGGAVPNPIRALAQILAALHQADGRVALDGFYDDVREIDAREKVLMARLPFEAARFKTALGLNDLCGEAGFTPLEQIGLRPTLEFNGIWGGFSGAGLKTVIPAEAHAKITCRLVPDQDPRRVIAQLQQHVERHAPRGVSIGWRYIEKGARAYRVPLDHPGNRAAADVLTAIYAKPPVYMWEGGSIPVTSIFLDQLNVYTIGFSFGLDDEQYHAPNEFFRLSSFKTAQIAYGRMLDRLAAGEAA